VRVIEFHVGDKRNIQSVADGASLPQRMSLNFHMLLQAYSMWAEYILCINCPAIVAMSSNINAFSPKS
jgi:hypothetical protein